MKIFIFAKKFAQKLLLKLRCFSTTHYINGPDILPPPFTASEEDELLSRLDESPEEVKSELITHNLRLVVYIAKKFEVSSAGLEDLISIGTIGLIKAVGTFRPEKGIKLATYASRCIENEILMYLRKTSNLKAEVSLDEPLNVDWDGNELLLSDILGTEGDEISRGIETQNEHDILKNLVCSLPPRERQIMEMRFGMFGYEEYTQKQIADCLGISQSYISRLEKRIIDKLKRAIEKAI
ncbi:MAG: RNA polymerase sporulation sigma factor SigE [Clostridia bacterium]|nr:RNA polymerase sporulation sigma factor SigE [Clostridia bacterium]MBQ9919373.1 RNA polymerase sporulation sigma factor SigE [Clostridia bacterium]